jgi:hypothetical protein
MAKRISFFGPTAASTTAATVFTNLVNTVARLESFTIATPAGALATHVRLSMGTDGTTTRTLEQAVPAGPQQIILYPGWNVTGTTILQLSTTGVTGVPICVGSGTVDVA